MPSGFIYSIVCNETGEVYYGSTTQNVSERIFIHNSNMKRWNEGKTNYCASYEIIERNNYTVSTIETVEFEDKTELYERERFYIENNDCVNCRLPVLTTEERTEQAKERGKIWRENNKGKFREYKRRYREKKRNETENK